MMKKYIQLFSNLPNYLAYQIFTTFWFTLATLIGFALLLPSFDARTFSQLEQHERHHFEKETAHTQKQYNLDEIFERRLSVDTANGSDVILFERHTGIFVGFEAEQLKALQAFIYQANDPQKPLKKSFDNLEIIGPFATQSEKREYFQYFIQNVTPQQAVINFFFDSPWLMFAILLFVSTPILYWLSRKIAKPVQRLRLSANAVASGNLSINPKLETEGINELREVGKSFNQMIKALQELNNHQQRMLSDISHELKTPLARLQLATALLRRRNGESNEITRIDNEIQKMNTMVLDLLALSRQQLNQHLTKEIFPINHIWDNVIIDAEFEAEHNDLILTVSQRIAYPERYFINGNVAILASSLENIVRNAFKYANKNIKLLIDIKQNILIIAIDDDGLGVPDEAYPQLFKPFYRVDDARSRETGGTGLGLAIVENAIQQHHGTVHAMKSILGGLRIEMHLPLWIE